MPKKRFVRGWMLCIVLLLILAAGAVLLLMPKSRAAVPDFSAMPTDTAGNNMIGNLSENLAAGGFMAGQNGWIYFTNFSDDGKLYMCRENGEDMTKLTDFPVCNINVMRSTVVFTGFDDYNEYISKGSGKTSGKLYAIYGLHTASKPRFCVIDPDNDYFAPYLDRDGLYAVRLGESQSVLANKSNRASMIITREGEAVTAMHSYGDTIYAELFEEAGRSSRIMRIDAQTLFPIDSINGNNLHRIGNSFVFHGEDGFVYEIAPSSGDIKPISSVPVVSFSANAFGEITAAPLTDSADFLVITKQRRYGGFAEMLLPRINTNAITLQNGWYSYKTLNLRHDGDTVCLQANGAYYSYRYWGGKWSADWLNVAGNAEPLVSLDDVIVEDAFTPVWFDFSDDAEPIDPADAGDFGSERPVRPAADDRPDAASDAQNALDAAILLLLEDERIADRYTGESVEKLRELYGDAFETALSDAANRLVQQLASHFGASRIDVSAQEAHDILTAWLQGADYEVGDARMSADGAEAVITVTVTNPVHMQLLYASTEVQAGTDLTAADIAKAAARDSYMSDRQIYMRLTNGDSWMMESPDKDTIIGLFVQGLDER